MSGKTKRQIRKEQEQAQRVKYQRGVRDRSERQQKGVDDINRAFDALAGMESFRRGRK